MEKKYRSEGVIGEPEALHAVQESFMSIHQGYSEIVRVGLAEKMEKKYIESIE